MIYKNIDEFKRSYKELFKKYHPDNKETGDSEKFIKYKKIYDKVLKDREKNLIYADISIDQAYFGTSIKKDSKTIIIPAGYYPKGFIEVSDKNGQKIKVKINIIPNDDEVFEYSKKLSELMIIKYVHLDIFDIILGCKKSIKIFGETFQIILKPFETLGIDHKTIKGKGYPKRFKRCERNDLTIRFKYDTLSLSEDDKEQLKEMSKHYGKSDG
jgi:DnaJ-class molecular chaperone